MIHVGSSFSCCPDVLVDPSIALVSHFLSAIGLDPDRAGKVVEPLHAWLHDVVAWNRRIDLTAARDESELLDLMFADAVVLAERLPSGEHRVVDVGTGAGAPGIPLAILRPELGMTLVEPLQKRVALLRMTAGKLQRSGVCAIDVIRGKGEDVVGGTDGAKFDVALSRATLAPPAWLELGARPADEVVVMVAPHDAPTLDGWGAIDDHRYRWPLTGAERRLIRYRRACVP